MPLRPVIRSRLMSGRTAKRETAMLKSRKTSDGLDETYCEPEVIVTFDYSAVECLNRHADITGMTPGAFVDVFDEKTDSMPWQWQLVKDGPSGREWKRLKIRPRTFTW